MVAKCFFRPISLPFTSFCPTLLVSLKPSGSDLTFVSQLCIAAHAFTCQTFPYGPSLWKGKIPSQYPSDFEKTADRKLLDQCKEDGAEEEKAIAEEEFTREFGIAALRVPAKDCFALENRLRGHLLNWPRIRNIARVPGDEVGEEFVSLLGDSRKIEDEEAEHGDLVVLDPRTYGKEEGDGESLSLVLYREKLAKEFNSKGYVKFRNLAKISRPKRKKKRKEENGDGGSEGIERNRKNEFAVVEVVEEQEERENWKGLLGDEFKGKWKWKGSTRLLLLDERYAEKRMEELPRAIKVAFEEAMKDNLTSTFELVRCKLTLFYEYWQMNEVLETLLPKDMIVPSAFETVGHIAHLNLRDEHLPYKKLIAKVVLDKHKPKIQTVVNKIDAIHNDYRTMQLEVLAGNHSLVTMVVENGLRFNVDLATVYWNSRLATERQRLLNGFTRDDVVCIVYANDLNPHAVDYLERNSVLNKLERKIRVFNMDGRRFINAMFTSEKAHSITQVVMNLPNDAVEYLGMLSYIVVLGHR
ncbi:hypothetical protein K2173_003079 [Erythroxylum novogranatense]|uniref:SAM-dependent methyltransferase TRM5/TYW2-type domain-containing protein n=1 Tax=Erythroxylum novogranatense TaxID=1862640 RepID=A0AAV8TA99_9ROSI|nr:hypothetical protein K2173_003079 [Erythroxylum novogranatense]